MRREVCVECDPGEFGSDSGAFPTVKNAGKPFLWTGLAVAAGGVGVIEQGFEIFAHQALAFGAWIDAVVYLTAGRHSAF